MQTLQRIVHIHEYIDIIRFLFLLYPTCIGLGPAWSILSYTEGLALQGPGQRVVITDFMY